MTSVTRDDITEGGGRAAQDRAAVPAAAADAWTRGERLLLLGAGLAYALLYLVFWPRAYAIMDESAYLGLAYALRQGTVYSDVAGINTVFDLTAGPHQIVMYPLGLPSLLALVSFAGWKAVLGVNLVMHLGAFALAAVILRRLRLPAAFALLYLLHPTAAIYSRTIMSDILTGLLFAATFWSYLNRRYTLAGVLMGVALLVRNASLLGGPLLMLACLLESAPRLEGEGDGRGMALRLPADWRERVRTAIMVLLGWLPFFLFAYWYQKVVQDDAWRRFPLLKPATMPQGLKTYATFLLVMYPLMLLAPLAYHKAGKAALCCLCYGFILLYSCYDFQDVAAGKLESFVVGQRYLLTMMPLFVVSYAAVVWGLAEKFRAPMALRRLAGVAAGLALACATIGVHYKHHKLLKETALVRDVVGTAVAPGDVLVCNSSIAKLFHVGWNYARTFHTLPFDPDSIRKTLEEQGAKVTGKGQRLVVAAWTRDYRTEAGGEGAALRYIENNYETRPLLPSERRGELPPGVTVLQILGPRQAAASESAPDGGMTSSSAVIQQTEAAAQSAPKGTL
jgi:hypothetical protein